MFFSPLCQAQTGRDELGGGRLDGGAIWTDPAEGEGAAGPSGAFVQREQAETAAAGQHQY